MAFNPRLVDSRVRGDDEGREIDRVIASRPAPPVVAPGRAPGPVASARPVDVSPKELDAIARSGRPSPAVRKRLEGASSPATGRGAPAGKKSKPEQHPPATDR